MGHRIVWTAAGPYGVGIKAEVQFTQNGPKFLLLAGPSMIQRCDEPNLDQWEWRTEVVHGTMLLPLFSKLGKTDLGEADARRAAEEAIYEVAEQAREWHQAVACAFVDARSAGMRLIRENHERAKAEMTQQCMRLLGDVLGDESAGGGTALDRIDPEHGRDLPDVGDDRA